MESYKCSVQTQECSKTVEHTHTKKQGQFKKLKYGTQKNLKYGRY